MAISLKVHGVDSQLMSSKEATATKEKVRTIREEIRKVEYEIQHKQIQRRKTHVILVSTSKYPKERQLDAVEDFKTTAKELTKLDKKLSELFDHLYIANTEYLDAHGMEITV